MIRTVCRDENAADSRSRIPQRQDSFGCQQVIAASDRFEVLSNRPFFKEFVVKDRQGAVESLLSRTERQGVLAGIPLGKWYADMNDCFLVAVTEKRTKAQIDRWFQSLTVRSEEFAANA